MKLKFFFSISLVVASLFTGTSLTRAQDARPQMDQWLTGEEKDRMRKDIWWAQTLATATLHRFQTGEGEFGSGCYPERNLCFNNVSIITEKWRQTTDDATLITLVTYTLAVGKDKIIGRKFCFKYASPTERICQNFYSTNAWHEELRENGRWEMVGEVFQNKPLQIP